MLLQTSKVQGELIYDYLLQVAKQNFTLQNIKANFKLLKFLECLQIKAKKLRINK